MRPLSPRVVITLSVLLAGVLSAPRHANFSDNQVKLEVATRVLEGRGLVLDGAGFESQYPVTGRGGHQYASYPLLDCLIFLPSAVLLKVGFRWDPLPSLLMLGLVAWLLMTLADSLGLGAPSASVGTLLTLFGTPLFAMACYGYNHLVAIIGLASILATAVRPFRAWSWTLTGTALGLCLLVREDATLLAVPALVAAFAQRGSGALRIVRSLCELALGGLPFVGISFAYRIYRFGSTGLGLAGASALFEPWFSKAHLLGIAGLTVSPGKGAFWYALPLIIVFGLAPTLVRRWRIVILVIAVYSVTELLFHGRFVYWHGDWCWGPRYASGIFLFVLPLGWWLGTGLGARHGGWTAVWAVVLAAMLQAPSVFSDPVSIVLASVVGPLREAGQLQAPTAREPPPPGDQLELYFVINRSPAWLVWKELPRRLRWLLEDEECVIDLLRCLVAPLFAALSLVHLLVKKEPAPESPVRD